MKVLDLFAGLRGWSSPFADRGHDTFAVDLDERFDVDLHADVAALTLEDFPWRPDIVLASPPCERFSVLQIGRNWTPPPEHAPKTPEAAAALDLVRATMRLIHDLEPAFFVVENPVGKLRKLASGLEDLERRTVTFCTYGTAYQKPTDLWGGFPPSWMPRIACRQGSLCHESAPRGSRTGIQGPLTAAERAKIPAELGTEVCIAAERDLAAGARWAPTTLLGGAA